MDATTLDNIINATIDLEGRVRALVSARTFLRDAEEDLGCEASELGITATIAKLDERLAVARAALHANELAVAEGRGTVERLCATFLALRDGSADAGIDRAAFEAELAERADWIGDPDASCPHWLEGARFDAWEAAVDAAQRGQPALRAEECSL